jgi:energy-coupling factor transporter transmembrane protein EcfT
LVSYLPDITAALILTLATFSSVPASVTVVVITLCTLRLYIGTIRLPFRFVLIPLPFVVTLIPLTPDMLEFTVSTEATDDARDNRLFLFCFSLSDEDEGLAVRIPFDASGSNATDCSSRPARSVLIPRRIDPGRLCALGSVIVMLVFLPDGLSIGTPGVVGGLCPGVE